MDPLVTIHAERADDHELIADIYRDAFGRDNETRFLEAIRKSADFIPELSLVAVRRGELVGHILFSRIGIVTPGGVRSALGLAPQAVLPKVQRQGIGSALVRQGLRRAAGLKYEIVLMVGHPNFYPRFGFQSARPLGLEPPFPVPEEVFLVHELKSGALEGLSGDVVFSEPFSLL